MPIRPSQRRLALLLGVTPLEAHASHRACARPNQVPHLAGTAPARIG